MGGSTIFSPPTVSVYTIVQIVAISKMKNPLHCCVPEAHLPPEAGTSPLSVEE